MTKKSEPLNADEYRALQYFRQAKICTFLESDNAVKPCLRYMQGGKERVDLVLNGAGRAFYRNLQTCNRVWLCPICASKIARKRRAKLSAIVDALQREGMTLAFITYTIDHHQRDSFEQVRRVIQDAYREFHSHRQWSLIQDKFAWFGSIRALEITLTDNGWHIHLHEIGFIEGKYDKAAFEAVLASRWAHMVERSGGSQLTGVGLKLKRTDRQIRLYITKWGIVPELTGFSSKGAYAGGAAPFQLPDIALRDAARESWTRDKFAEYAAGIKGAKQLMPGKAIKQLLGEDIAESEPEDIYYPAIASLSPEQWRFISTTGQRVRCLRAIEDGLLEKFLRSNNL